ncbi:hypothetical protein P0082_08435 [Candidatus Haliotispira prima]|uniref:Outer membrane protein beta-barrel domain-containing protein n=1 Tax=Candidatus Haliotispira prima TaxID=3034016 RepID=A0ABY8MGQ9_9SPIO|nr:hypothetical protein P0082_08435 [Candidatus Haliotispira prima]
MRKIYGKVLLLVLFLLPVTNLTAQESEKKSGRGPISIFINGGLGGLSGSGEVTASGTKVGDVTDAKLGITKIGLGASYSHPVNEMLSIGALLELRLLINKIEGKVQNGSFTINFSDGQVLGFGVSFGPYFRLGLWGTDKQGGLGLAPYIAINSLRGEIKGKNASLSLEYTEEALLNIGGGLLLDIFFTNMFGIHLGLELEGTTAKVTDDQGVWTAEAPLFGAIFYGGVSVSF